MDLWAWRPWPPKNVPESGLGQIGEDTDLTG